MILNPLACFIFRFVRLGLLGVLAYTFARIGAVVNLKVEDYYPSGKRFLLRFKEKGGKEKELPVHQKLEELKATGLGSESGSLLFPAALGKTGKLSRRPLARTDAADMLKRRLKQANKRGCRFTIRLIHSGRPGSRIFWKMMVPLNPLSE
jgi:integrase